MIEADRARDALQHIPPDLPRDEWVRAGMAAHAAGLDFDTFNDWSAQGGNYSERDARDTWRSFKPGRGIGAGTLYQMAAELGGWRNEGDRRPRTNGDFPATMKTPVVAPAKPPRAGMAPAEIWSRCEPATDSQPYITQKQGAPERLRVVPAGDSLTIQRESMAGALVVPALRQDGTISSLQLIAAPETAQRLKAAGKPAKLNLPGARLEGWFTVGDMVPGGEVYLCEGIGQAWACWKATGRAAVVCFGWGRVRTVAAELRQRDESSRLVLVPDVGKELDAQRIARDVGATVAAMPEGWPNNSDVNDLAQREGFDVLEILLSKASEPARLLKPVSVGDVLTNPAPPPAFVLDGYLPRGVVALFGAHGGTGKSTITLMLAVAVATGRPLFGVGTERCPAVFVSLEDGANIVRHRLAGICRAWGIKPADLVDLHIVDGTENPELFAADHRSAGDVTPAYAEMLRLVESAGAGLVVVDNASDAFGGDEIQRRQVRAFMRALGQVARRTNCAVMLLSHVDKSTSRNKRAEGGEGYSGSTAWHNSARSRLFMSRGDDGLLTLEHQKSNLGQRREPITLTWPDGGLPVLVGDAPNFDGLTAIAHRRADDESAAALLGLIAEFEGRGQFCSPAAQARNNVAALLRSEPAFQRLKLNRDTTARIVNQCQRAGWIEPLDYRSPDRKPRQRWTVTPLGRNFAGLPAPTAPTAPTSDEGALGADSSNGGAPTAPTYAGGVGDRARTHEGADEGADEGCHG